MNVRWILACTVLLIVSVHGQDPEIVDEIWPEVKPVGRTARLNCTVANKKNHVVVWQLTNTKEVISQDLKIDIINPVIGGMRKYEVQQRGTTDRQTFMLIIRRLRQQDAGRYLCMVRIQGTTNENDWPSKNGTLTVQVAPTIRPGDTTAVLETDQGANATLVCAATGIPAPNITWTRSDGGRLPVGGAQWRSAELPLRGVTVQMGGIYRCIADNNIKPPARHLAEVLVFHAPTVRVVQDSVGQAQNRRFDAKLECIVQGHPEPTVRWHRIVNGGVQVITDNDKFDINKQTTDNQNLKAGEQWYTLKVKNVQANDYTAYYCSGTNKKGSDEKIITLFETTECQGPNCPSLPAGRAAGAAVPHILLVLVTALSSLVSRGLH